MQSAHSNTWLTDLGAARGVGSVINTIVAALPRRANWRVEFGAWDGKLASNSRDLILQHGFSAVLIEGDEKKFRDLQETYSTFERVQTIHQYVGFDSTDGLDAILTRTPIPRDFDLLSIDIDGNDYHAWNAAQAYRPKVVCIEFNLSIPPEVSFAQPADPRVNQGSSLAALVELGKKKHYELVAVVGVDALFVEEGLYPLCNITDNSIEALWRNRDQITYIFCGYDGHVFLRGCQIVPWHEIPLQESKVQHVPFYLRRYPFSRQRRILYTMLHAPWTLVPKIIPWIRRSVRRWASR